MSAPEGQSKSCGGGEKKKWSRVPSTKLPVSQFRNVYQSVAEVEKAKRDGTFDINKTMILKNGRIYFLCTT